MARAIVFAGESFIGRHLREKLCRQGWSITATSRIGSAGTVACDLLDGVGVREIVSQAAPTHVFQCAGATASNDLRQAFDLHVMGTLNVLDAVRRHAADAGVVLMGSAAEYGLTTAERLPITEDHPAVPASFFGASKLAQTQSAQAAAREWGLRIISVRPFNVIGPGLPEHYFAAAVAARLRRMAGSGRVKEFAVGNLHATRDFVDVRDVADAMIGLANNALPQRGRCSIYNIATGIETSLLQMAQELGRLAGGWVPVAGEEMASRGGAVRSCGSAALLRQAIDWEPRRLWQESLCDMWARYAVPAQAG